MSPYQHGEVFVTSDGAETDLDLGHYERFIDEDLTQGQLADHGPDLPRRDPEGAPRRLPRRHDPGGPAPHATRSRRASAASAAITGAQVVIIEVGGTVGDIEGQAFLEAIRQMRREERLEDTLSIHVTFLPYIWRHGRAEDQADAALRAGAASHGHPARRHPAAQRLPGDAGDRATRSRCSATSSAAPSMPLPTVRQHLRGAGAARRRGPRRLRHRAPAASTPRRATSPTGARWSSACSTRTCSVNVAVVGKYVELHDAYLSVKEALIHAGAAFETRVDILWVHAEQTRRTSNVAGQLRGRRRRSSCPAASASAASRARSPRRKYARENNIPYLGLCLGMQVMVVESARAALGTDARRTRPRSTRRRRTP